MQFTRLWPLGLLIGIPILILLYMLKKKNQPKVVSSIFLWQEIYENTYADKPWQKLKNHILLILQCLAILLLVLALMAPKVLCGTHYYKNVIFVVDTSASMNAKYEETTRLEAAKEWMRHYIKEAGQETKGYIIAVGEQVELELAGSSQQQVILSAIDQIKSSYTSAKLDEGIQMAKTLGESIQEAYEVVVLTDQKQEQAEDIHRVYFGKGGMNGAITLMAHQENEQVITVLIQVINKGNKAYVTDVSLYGEQELLDVQEIKLEPGESKTLHFEIPKKKEAKSYAYLKGELSSKDDLDQDNVYYYVQDEEKSKKVLLITESNVFLEKALMSLKNCEVYKSNDLSLMSGKEDYDLYVLDNQIANLLPEKGNVLLVGSSSQLTEETPLNMPLKIETVDSALPDYLQNLNFTVNECTSYKVPYWGKGILKAGNQTVGWIGEKDGQKIGVLGFDLWSSDFVLKTDFPLLMYYLGNEMLDTSIVSKSNFISDETVEIHHNSSNEKIQVESPSGQSSAIENGRFMPNQELGIYQIQSKKEKQESEEGTNSSKSVKLIAVNYPAHMESDLSQDMVGEQVPSQEAESLKGEKDITPYVIILLLGVVLTEWYFYRKGY